MNEPSGPHEKIRAKSLETEEERREVQQGPKPIATSILFRMEIGRVAPITGCVRADLEAQKLLLTIRSSIESGRILSGGSARGQSVKLSEHLEESFRSQQALVSKNAALEVHIEQLTSELFESRRSSQGSREVEVSMMQCRMLNCTDFRNILVAAVG